LIALLVPRSVAAAPDIARHYDELDFFYRQLWGEHLHHGLWEEQWEDDPQLSIQETTRRLLKVTIAPLSLQPGERVVDIGCGYGAEARWIAEHTAAHVTGITLSALQVQLAKEHPPPVRGSTVIQQGDWLHNDFDDHSFGVAVAIESLAHMPDKRLFFRQLSRTLASGGRAAIACWTAAPDCSFLETILLRRLCRDGQLPSLGTLREYRELAEGAGLRFTNYRDLTTAVEPTWWIIGRRAAKALWSLQFLRASILTALRRPSFVLTIPSMMLAYRTQALRYGILWLEK
jgi:tocopherol O-methyltransferase